MAARIEPMVGRYVHLSLGGRDCRVYFEEAGSGIPLLCLHTAGADGRQFRHLMNDTAVTDHFRVIAFDLPWHGKSTPPVGWQDEEYALTTAAYVEAVMTFSRALDLERPVVMGCSMGGRIVLELAAGHGRELGAVIGLEAADHQTPWHDTEWLHRPDVHGGEVCAALVSGLVGAPAPDEHRWETLWGYMQSGPGVFKGDLYFYRVDSDFRERVAVAAATRSSATSRSATARTGSLWQRLLGRPVSKYGRLCHGAGGPEGGGRCRRAFMLTILGHLETRRSCEAVAWGRGFQPCQGGTTGAEPTTCPGLPGGGRARHAVHHPAYSPRARRP